MSEKTSYKLDEVCIKITDGAHKSPPSFSNGYPMASVKDMEYNKINLNTCRLISEEDYNDLVRNDCKPKINDILIAKDGSYLKHVFEVTKEEDVVLLSSIAIIRPDTNKVLPIYLKYIFKNPVFRNTVEAYYVSGAVIPRIVLKDFKKIDIILPPLEKQKAIAEVLSSFDDKIDLLHRQNKTLEELAQTLFRQWFIEEAKDEWEEKPLSGIANFLNGLACQKFPPQNDIDKLPVLKIKDLKAGISDSSDWATTDIKPEYIIESGDVIFAWSASLMVKIWDGKKCILNQHLFKVTSNDYPKWFYYQWCQYHLDRFIAIAQAHATTMGHIKRKDLDNAMCFVPTDSEMKVMDEQMVPLMEKMENNSKQIKTLENMRDTLLPKLMSGEVRINL